MEKETIKHLLNDSEFLSNSETKVDPKFSFSQFEKEKKSEKMEEFITNEITDNFFDIYKNQIGKVAINEKYAERLGRGFFVGFVCFLGYFGGGIILAYYYNGATSIMGYEKEEMWEEQEGQNSLEVYSSLTENLDDVIISGDSENGRSDMYIQEYEEDDISASIDMLSRFAKTELFVIQGPVQFQDKVYNQFFRPLPFYSAFIKYVGKKNASEHKNRVFFKQLHKIHDLNLIIFDLETHTEYKKRGEFLSEFIKRKNKKLEININEPNITKSLTIKKRQKEDIYGHLQKGREREIDLHNDFTWGIFGTDYYDFLMNFENDFYPVLMYHDFIRRDFGRNMRENNKVIEDPFILYALGDINDYDVLYEKQKYYSFLIKPKKRNTFNIQMKKLKIYKNNVFSVNPYDSYMNLSFLSLPRNKNKNKLEI